MSKSPRQPDQTDEPPPEAPRTEQPGFRPNGAHGPPGADDANAAWGDATEGTPPPNGAHGPGTVPLTLHWHRDADTVVQRSWLVRNLFASTGKGLISGQWGTGKTFITLDLAGSVMTGQSFAGRRMQRRGGVLFIAPEGASEIPLRLRGMVQARVHHANLPDVNPADLPFVWAEECPRLVNADALAVLTLTADLAAAEMQGRYGLPLGLIVIDTVAAGAGFDDENSAAETQKVMNALERLSQHTGAFVLGVDHFGKAVETGTRGSSAKEAAADTVLAALGTRDESGGVSNLRMAVRKVRGAPTGAQTSFLLDVIPIGEDDEGEPLTTCAVRWLDGPVNPTTIGEKERWPKSLKVLHDALGTALVEHGIRAWPFNAEGPECRATPLKKAREAFYAIYPANGDDETKRAAAKLKAFTRAVQNAQGHKLIGSIELKGVDHLYLQPTDAPQRGPF